MLPIGPSTSPTMGPTKADALREELAELRRRLAEAEARKRVPEAVPLKPQIAAPVAGHSTAPFAPATRVQCATRVQAAVRGQQARHDPARALERMSEGPAAAEARRRALERAREREARRNEDYDAEAAERRPAQRLNKEERTVLCCLVLGILLYFCCVVVAFAALADVPSGCAVALLMVAFALSFKSGEKENRCRLRAALVIHVLGLLLLVVAMVLLAMKTHRVMSLTPDPTCEPWAGSCQEGGQRSDGRTECSDCSDEVSTCLDLSADGYWWSERGARYFPASEKYGRYWGWGRTRRLNGCGIPQKPSEGTDGSFGAIGNKEQKRRWEEAKEMGDCRPLFTSQAKCEDYWGRWQDAWSEEWGGACIVRLLFNAALLFYGFSFFSEIGPDILFFCLLTR